MTNIIEIVKPLIETAAKADWRIAAGLAGLAILAGVGRYSWKRIKQRRTEK
ncbi:MAG: hypothetical protein PHU12_04225 [Candidatus Aenigmarchaeota archaeon]|nr:hypothetical protein [Candidatus Aenigmarchaeota archaeon]